MKSHSAKDLQTIKEHLDQLIETDGFSAGWMH